MADSTINYEAYVSAGS